MRNDTVQFIEIIASLVALLFILAIACLPRYRIGRIYTQLAK